MLHTIQEKIKGWDAAARQVRDWQAAGERIVFTNGCFDLLHYGHLVYLAQARGLGDRLVLGLNDAGSVSRLKGAHRPINDEQTRQWQMASLQCVDIVVSFAQDTPLELITLLQPDLLVKGGDYQISEIVGAEIVQQKGGEVRTLPYIQGYSTTSIEEKIRKQNP